MPTYNHSGTGLILLVMSAGMIIFLRQYSKEVVKRYLQSTEVEQDGHYAAIASHNWALVWWATQAGIIISVIGVIIGAAKLITNE
jgi:hypothetical protein